MRPDVPAARFLAMRDRTGPAGPAGRRPASRRDPGPDPRLGLVSAFARLWLEVEAGRRPPTQLYWLMAPPLVARLAGGWAPTGDPPGRVRTVTGTQTAPGRFDAVAVVQRGGRVGALAIRLARDAQGWMVTEVARPERPLPAPAAPRTAAGPAPTDRAAVPA